MIDNEISCGDSLSVIPDKVFLVFNNALPYGYRGKPYPDISLLDTSYFFNEDNTLEFLIYE